MTNEKIGLAPYHTPTVAAGKYIIEASLDNTLNKGVPQNINFHVAGYNVSIPQNEILAVYPPIEHTGDFAGTFPHIQFRRNTLPWEYNVNGTAKDEERLPYIFLLLLKEEELKDFEFITVDTNQLTGSNESPDEAKSLRVLKCNNSELFPKADLIKNLAHVRVQEHTEIKDLNLPKETSILISHRMVEPKTKYRAFVCYYAKKSDNKYEMIINLTKKQIGEYAVILNEWSFESIDAELYQIDSNKLKNHSAYNTFNQDLQDSEIDTLEKIKPKANSELKELLVNNELYIQQRDLKWKNWQKNNKYNPIQDFEKSVETITIDDKQYQDNHILEYLQYNGKNLKGYLHELILQPFKSFIKSPTLQDNSSKEEIEKDVITNLLNTSKVPLEHQLKAGGKIVSWYQSPFTNNQSPFNLLEIVEKQFDYVPDHQDYLNFFNEDTGMYDMTYSAAWQLGRLMIMNDNKVLQELKKWKYDLELYNLVLEQNKLSHLPNLSIQAPSIPDLLMDYITELVQFRNFPLYYLLPHPDLSTQESIKYFKIDNSWVLAFLFGIFSAGPKLTIKDFEKYLCTKLENVFNSKKDYYGILLQSQTIKNWPHLVVELNESSDFHYVSSINNSLRLYITDKPFSSIEIYLKNENAHFGKSFIKDIADIHTLSFEDKQEIKINKNYLIEDIIAIPSSVDLANNLLYKQPRVVFNIKQKP